MTVQHVSIKHLIERLLKFWWLIIILAIIGGISGFLLASAISPRYEAVARLSTSIDYSISPNIEDYQEDRIIQDVGFLIISDEVLRNTRQALSLEGIDISEEETREMFYIERLDDLWTLRVTNPDPRLAAKMANAWLAEAYGHIDRAFQHAITAAALATYIDSLDQCLYADPEEAENFALCKMNSIEAVAAEIQEKSETLTEELRKSRTIYPALRYNIISEAPVPQEATYQTRGILTFSGALLGGVAAMLVTLIITTRRIVKGGGDA